MSTPFTKLPEDDFDRHDEANQRRNRFKVIRSAVPSDDTTVIGADESAALAQNFALTTDAASLVIAKLDNRPQVRAFVDAVIGATGGSDDFVEVTDEELAKRIGRSTKSVQNYRNEFREVDAHGFIIEIKEHYRDATTLESHAHRYKCKVTALAVEAMQNARLMPQYAKGNEGRLQALEDAAEDVTLGAIPGVLRKAKRRKMKSDADVVASKMRQAASAVDDAAKRHPMVRNPDFEQLWELRQSVLESLKKFDEAYGFASDISTLNTDQRSVETPAPVFSDDPDLAPRMEAEDFPAGGKIEDMESAQVEKSSTWNDSIESTTCENAPDPPVETLTATYARETREAIALKVANGKSEAEAYAEVEDEIGDFEEWEKRRCKAWDRVFGGLTGGKRDG
jgi:hypothetical protein